MEGPLGSIAAAAPAIGMLGAFACLLGGGYLLVKGRDQRRGVLHIACNSKKGVVSCPGFTGEFLVQ